MWLEERAVPHEKRTPINIVKKNKIAKVVEIRTEP